MARLHAILNHAARMKHLAADNGFPIKHVGTSSLTGREDGHSKFYKGKYNQIIVLEVRLSFAYQYISSS